MAIAVTARPLVDLALPEKGASRLIGQIFLAVLGTLLLTISENVQCRAAPNCRRKLADHSSVW